MSQSEYIRDFGRNIALSHLHAATLSDGGAQNNILHVTAGRKSIFLPLNVCNQRASGFAHNNERHPSMLFNETFASYISRPFLRSISNALACISPMSTLPTKTMTCYIDTNRISRKLIRDFFMQASVFLLFTTTQEYLLEEATKITNDFRFISIELITALESIEMVNNKIGSRLGCSAPVHLPCVGTRLLH